MAIQEAIFRRYLELDREIKKLTNERDALAAGIKEGIEFAAGEKTKKVFTCDAGSIQLRKSVRESWDMPKLVEIVKQEKIPCKIVTTESVDVKELAEMAVDGLFNAELLKPALHSTDVISLVPQHKKGSNNGEE